MIESDEHASLVIDAVKALSFRPVASSKASNNAGGYSWVRYRQRDESVLSHLFEDKGPLSKIVNANLQILFYFSTLQNYFEIERRGQCYKDFRAIT